ncbi:unnamed protein product, partial [Laminaria digitata]
QVKETSALHLLFGLPSRGVRYALGYQMFGFEERPRQHQQQRQHRQQQQQQERQQRQQSSFGSNTSDASTIASMDGGVDAGGIRSMFLRRGARTTAPPVSPASTNGRGTGTGGRGRGGAA